MLMGMASRPIGDGTLQFRAMLSPDPLMGKRGYPLLLASGETANGTDRLIDRQHPHDFFMELSASISQNIGEKSSLFLYGGLPGEPAFGPPAFMHREAIMDSPEAPISHHWLDSTHISFGVLTGGLVLDRCQARGQPLQRARARPASLEHRDRAAGFDRGAAVLEPGLDRSRCRAAGAISRIPSNWSRASTRSAGRPAPSTPAKSRRTGSWRRRWRGGARRSSIMRKSGGTTPSSPRRRSKHGGWTIFGRGEMTENRELLDEAEHGEAFSVGKLSLGAVRDFRLAEHFSLGAGGLVAVNFIPDGLEPLYGGKQPDRRDGVRAPEARLID